MLVQNQKDNRALLKIDWTASNINQNLLKMPNNSIDKSNQALKLLNQRLS